MRRDTFGKKLQSFKKFDPRKAPPFSFCGPIVYTMLLSQSTCSQPKYAKYAQVGTVIHAKATNVSAELQCKQWYGSFWHNKWISVVHIRKKL
jgi:hypothetical protein